MGSLIYIYIFFFLEILIIGLYNGYAIGISLPNVKFIAGIVGFVGFAMPLIVRVETCSYEW